MLKKRIIALLLIRENIVVQSVNFKRYLPVGKPEIAVEALNDWGIDEIIVLDICARSKSLAPNTSLIREIAPYSIVPLTVGGGIHNISHVHELLNSGADKVCFNSSLHLNIDLVKQASKIYGDQCIVGSIDVINLDGKNYIFDHLTSKALELPLIDYLLRIQDFGVGEILLNSVNRDGAKCGYDIDLINYISPSIHVPLIICGGVGSPQHMIEALNSTRVEALAASNFFHFTEHSATVSKSLISTNEQVRHDSYAKYDAVSTDQLGRLLKKPEPDLTNLLYKKLVKEII